MTLTLSRIILALLPASCLLFPGIDPRGDDPQPIGIQEAPIVNLSISSSSGELCGTAWDHNHPIEIVVERVGENGELEIVTETTGNEVSFETTATSGDPAGTIYQVTATDKYGNSTVETLTR